MTYEYHEPTTLEEALALLAEHGDEATLLAGGTSFVLLSKLGLLRPGHVIGLRRVPELRGIRAESGGLWIGAHTTHAEVERSADVRSGHDVLADAFSAVATVRIRNQATVGGNLAHADPAQDPPPALMALGATAHISTQHGEEREVSMDDFFVDYFTTDLAADEILVGVSVPPMTEDAVATYMKFLPRTADDYATVSVAAVVRQDADGVIAEAALALGGVASTPFRAATVERAIIGSTPTPQLIEEVSHLIVDEINPLDDVRGSAGYKRSMAVVWLSRALSEVTGNGSP
jgi:carbon-monoxide dehydrogenase medium subunit